jgi:hypothetical protein
MDATLSEDSKDGATVSVIRDDPGALQTVEALWYMPSLDALPWRLWRAGMASNWLCSWGYGECS